MTAGLIQTYCYTVYNKKTGAWVGWYPTTSDKVVYQYSGWGQKIPSAVRETADPSTKEHHLSLRCEPTPTVSREYLQLHFSTDQPGSAVITIFDMLGRPVAQRTVEAAGSADEQATSLEISNLPSGSYMAIIRTSGASASARFIVTR